MLDVNHRGVYFKNNNTELVRAMYNSTVDDCLKCEFTLRIESGPHLDEYPDD